MDKECTILWLFIKIMSKASKKLCFQILMKETDYFLQFSPITIHTERGKISEDKENKPVSAWFFKNFSTN